jgi:hypothetical protein
MNAQDIPFFRGKFNPKARNCLMIPRGMLLAKISGTSCVFAGNEVVFSRPGGVPARRGVKLSVTG